MSTKFTKSQIQDAPSAPLTVLLQTSGQWVMRGVMTRLQAQGFDEITEPHLTLLGHLECGTSYAAAVAERMGVSRQAIARTLRDMEMLGYLRLERDPVRQNQKVIVMTDKGGALALAARAALAEVETLLAERIGPARLAHIRDALTADWGDI